LTLVNCHNWEDGLQVNYHRNTSLVVWTVFPHDLTTYKWRKCWLLFVFYYRKLKFTYLRPLIVIPGAKFNVYTTSRIWFFKKKKRNFTPLDLSDFTVFQESNRMVFLGSKSLSVCTFFSTINEVTFKFLPSLFCS
jgi:hypothetical protein